MQSAKHCEKFPKWSKKPCSNEMNFEGIEPMYSVNRWCSKEKAKVSVKQTKVIAEHNSGMGGVDLHDQAINNYRIEFRGIKWWFPLFTVMMNSLMINA